MSTRTASFTSPMLRQDGTTVIGGPNGFSGVIDELGVYYRDDQGRPSADPAQYLRTAQRKYGRDLVLAYGFETANLPPA